MAKSEEFSPVLEQMALEVLDEAKTDAEMWYNVGLAREARGEPMLAIEAFERCGEYESAATRLAALR